MGEFLDLSLNGARLSCTREQAAIGATLRLSVKVLVAGTPQQLVLSAPIKSVSAPKLGGSLEPFIYGLTFIDTPLPKQLLLQALCYELQPSTLSFAGLTTGPAAESAKIK